MTNDKQLVFFSDFEHSLDGAQSALANVFVDHDLKLLFPQRLDRVFKRDLIHVRATHGAKPQHLLIWVRGSDVVAHGTFGQ